MRRRITPAAGPRRLVTLVSPPLSDGASTARCDAGLTRADETDSPAHYPSGSANATRRASGPAPVAIRMNCRPARER